MPTQNRASHIIGSGKFIIRTSISIQIYLIRICVYSSSKKHFYYYYYSNLFHNVVYLSTTSSKRFIHRKATTYPKN